MVHSVLYALLHQLDDFFVHVGFRCHRLSQFEPVSSLVLTISFWLVQLLQASQSNRLFEILYLE